MHRIFAPIGLVLATAIGLAGCSGGDKPLQIAAETSCAGERAEFVAALASATGPSGSADAYWQGLRRSAAKPADAARVLAQDLTRLGGAIDQLNSSYGGLRACRIAIAEQIKLDVAGGLLPAARAEARLAGLHGLFDDELHRARGGADRLAASQAMLTAAAERLVAEAPGSDLKLAKAVAAPPLPAQAYLAIAATTIYPRPDAGSRGITELRRGIRAYGPGDNPASGWTTLTLNDGSVGYVQSAALRPVPPNASAVKAAARSQAARAAEGDAVVIAALAARQTIPEKSGALASILDTAQETGSLAFNPELPASRDVQAMSQPGLAPANP